MRWALLVPLLVVTAAAPGVGTSRFSSCGPWAVQARIAGEAVCLREQGRCKPRLELAYRGYGFTCLLDRLYARWAYLRDRPLTELRLSPGEPCPVTTTTSTVLSHPALGPGPAAPIGTGNVIAIRLPPPEGWGPEWSGTKRVWLLDTRYAARALVRGRQLDGPNEVRFVRGIPGFTEAKILNPLRALRVQGSTPSLTRVREPGCYTYQVDTRTRSYLVVFEAQLAP